MDPLLTGILGLIVLFLLIFMRVPIGFAMAVIGFIGFGIIAGFGPSLSHLGNVSFMSVASFTLSVIPLFVLMGYFASNAGIIGDAFKATHDLLGQLPGGLAIATIGACAGFAACTGSSIAAAATMTQVALPEMKRHSYDNGLATGTIAAGGTLGILIPPSVPFCVYGIITEQSIGQLFMAGIIPGIMMTFLFVFTISTLVGINPKLGPRGPRTSTREKLMALPKFWSPFILIAVVLGGIWGGIFTPSEAGALGAFAAMLIALIRRRLTLKSLVDNLSQTATSTAMIFAIVIGAMIFGYFLTLSGVPKALADFVHSMMVPPLVTMVVIIVMYIILGCIMDTLAMTLITIPIIFPLVIGAGYDPILFGVIFVITGEMALITPPIGMNVFVISGMAQDIPMYSIFKGVFPFLIPMLLSIILILIFPQIALFLPQTMMAK